MPSLSRRTVLKALAAAGLLPPFALAAGNDELAAFLTLSALLVGRDWLDPAQGQPLYTALVAEHGDFPQQCLALLGEIHDRALPASALQAALDVAHSPLAGVPRLVARAWLQGVVGSGARARCLAYETALNAQMVADVLRPPSYAYGAYGSWATERADG